MYRRHSKEIKQKLIEARQSGSSIPEIMTLFGIPKTTVWHIVNKVSVPPDRVRAIMSRRGGSNKRKIDNLKKAEIQAENLLSGEKREYAIMFSMLYWAEGTKKSCTFVNTDGAMIALFIFCAKVLFGIDKDRMTFTLRIFGDMDRDTCLEHWSKTIGVQKNRFIVRLNDGGTNSRKHHGMLSIIILRGHLILKIVQALYQKIHKEVLTKDCPRSSTD